MTKQIDELMELADLCIQASHFKEVDKTYSHYVDSRRKLRTALEAFATIVRNATLEEAASLCETPTERPVPISAYAAAIRSLKS
jgi:hypothetical protein